MAAGNPLYCVRAEAVPVTITAHQLGVHEFRIHIGRGIGWAPEKFKTRDAVLKKLLAMQSYGIDEARLCKLVCKPNP